MSETLINTNQNQLNNDDASFVELIQKAQKGKAKVVQAIINKGGDVSTASTYDQLTQAVNNLDTCDGKGKYLVESFYDVYSDANNIPTDIIMATFLPHHNAFIGVTTSGLINIYKPNSDGNNIIPIASVSTGLSFSTDGKYLIFGYNKSETKFVFYDSHTDHKYLVVLFMDWTTNTLELKLNYVVQSDVGGTYGRYESGYSKSGSTSVGITINDLGSCIVYISSYQADYEGQYCLSTFIPDYTNNTVTENTGFGQTGYNYTVTTSYAFANSIYYLDTENGVLEGLDPYRCLVKFDIDLTGTHPKITNYTNTHPSPKNSENYWYNSAYPLILKDIDNTLDYYVFFVPPISGQEQSRKGTLYLNKYSGTDNTLYDSISFDLIGSGIKTSYSWYNDTTLLNAQYAHINYYIKNNEIYLLLPSNIIVKIDRTGTTPKFVLYSTNGLKLNNKYVIRPTGNRRNGSTLYVKIYSPTDYNKMLAIYSPGLNAVNCRSNEIIQFREPCVLGQKFTDSKGSEFFSPFDFSMSSYESGAYRLASETNTLETL